jgi:rare lipoprotein A
MHKFLLALLLCGSSLSHAQNFQWDEPSTTPSPQATYSDPLADETGLASVYADYYEGNPTALGEVFHQYEFTAAHAKLPLGSLVEVTRLDNGLTTNVRINDRGAFCEGCIIDLSKAAAQQLGLATNQQARVKLTVTGFRQTAAPTSVTVAPSQSASPEPEPQFTTKGVPSPNPHPYNYEIQDTKQTTEVSRREAVIPARTVSRPAVSTKQVATTEMTDVQTINYLPAPYAVQLGSYNRFANAERHALRLQQAGFSNIFILQESEVGHDPLHRVLISPFPTLSEAEDFADEVQNYHQMRAIILHNKLVEISVD